MLMPQNIVLRTGSQSFPIKFHNSQSSTSGHFCNASLFRLKADLSPFKPKFLMFLRQPIFLEHPLKPVALWHHFRGWMSHGPGREARLHRPQLAEPAWEPVCLFQKTTFSTLPPSVSQRSFCTLQTYRQDSKITSDWLKHLFLSMLFDKNLQPPSWNLATSTFLGDIQF